MSKQEVISYLGDKVSHLEGELKKLDSQIAELSGQREKLAKAHASYQYALEIENAEASNKVNPEKQLPTGLPQFAELSIPRAAELILRQAGGRGMSTKEIIQEMRKRGKGVNGPNSYTVIYSSLKRAAERFKKNGRNWMLANRDGDTRAA